VEAAFHEDLNDEGANPTTEPAFKVKESFAAPRAVPYPCYLLALELREVVTMHAAILILPFTTSDYLWADEIGLFQEFPEYVRVIGR
jgi:hypothetical protein